MAAPVVIILLLLNVSLFSRAQNGPGPLQIFASTRPYGPDGPWQAVSVQFGSPPQDLDLYPGGVYESSILTNQLCLDITVSPCGSGGLFNPQNSNTINETGIAFGTETKAASSSLWSNNATLFSYSNTIAITDELQIAGQTVMNLSAIMYDNITMAYPDGNYPLQLGQLSLGPGVNQTFTEGTGNPAVNASLIPGSLAAQNVIPSSSYGLHVGFIAAKFKVDLSLWLGGYDASRIVGPVSSQTVQNDANNEFIIDLLDIGIGVDNGESPFLYSSLGGLLSSGNDSITRVGIPITMNPGAPYLNLPNSTCDAIVKDLPVTYDAQKALYLWNANDPQYTKIVTSPTYLSFTFRGSSGNLTINVPFQLLNLTLEAPLAATPTPYFPCQPPQAGGAYSLGRAFLQAAFIGVTWARGADQTTQWYLAQAPGPDIDTNAQQSPITNGSPLVGLNRTWSDTWRGFWTPLPTSTANTTVPPSPDSTSVSPKHGLSGGAIAGIAIGGVCAAAIAVGVVILLFRCRGGNTNAVQHNSGDTVYPLVPLDQTPPSLKSEGGLVEEVRMEHLLELP